MFEVTSQDVVYLASPYTFDPSIVQMFIAFYNGAELLITPQTTKLIPERLCQKLNQHRVTILQVCAGILQPMSKQRHCNFEIRFKYPSHAPYSLIAMAYLRDLCYKCRITSCLSIVATKLQVFVREV